MSGNSYQYNPAEMFKEWIQKSGKAQTEFMKNFSSMMNPQSQQFDPLGTLKEIKQDCRGTIKLYGKSWFNAIKRHE